MPAGSPPRVRGKLVVFGCVRFAAGITPACAGKTHIAPRLFLTFRDHPRVCGENCVSSTVPPAKRGSPPRVRGKLLYPASKNILPGITPACAGKTNYGAEGQGHGWDHPRVCGENDAAAELHIPELGSPPRVRGKPPEAMGRERGEGITPACAGKTLRSSSSFPP